jgi:hypothetical protein
MESDMTGSFKFFKDSKREEEDKSSGFSEAKVMVYEDGGENKYILDASDIDDLAKIDDLKLSDLKDIKIKYQPKGSSSAEEVKGLGNIIGKLFATKNASTPGSKTMLEEEVAKKPVVEAIFDATDTDGKKSILVEKLGTLLSNNATPAQYEGQTEQKPVEYLASKGKLITEENLEAKAASVPVAGAILGATSDEDGKKSILVEKLGGFLPENDAVYEGKKAKDFLVSKGLGSASADPSAVATELITNKAAELGTAILGVKKKVNNVDKPALEADLVAHEALRTAVKNALASDTNFGKDAKIKANAEDPVFQGAVRDVMSKPVFDIPTNENEPLSWDWI